MMARRILYLLAFLALLATAIPWLPTLLSTVEPLPEKADAVFVFPGEVPDRALCAVDLFHRGIAPRLVLSGGRTRPELIAVGRPLADALVNATVAADNGVPLDAQVVLPTGTSTWEDVAVLRGWLRHHPAARVIAITSPIHSRRALYALELGLAGTGTEVSIYSCSAPDGPESQWWLDEQKLIGVTNEALKMGLYAVRYFVPTLLGLRAAPEIEPAAEPEPTPQPFWLQGELDWSSRELKFSKLVNSLRKDSRAVP